MKPITILIAEDHTIVREGFRRMLELETELRVVGEAQDGRQAVAMAQKLVPDIVLMDIAMPLLNGLEATRQVLQALPKTKVLILSAHSDDAYVNTAIEAGAMGFLLKQTSSHDVCRAIRLVYGGARFFTPSVAKRLEAQDRLSLGRGRSIKPRSHGLSSREAEVLQLIAEGKANKEVASELGISIKTVEKHREHLMQKLNIHEVAGLTRYAISSGLIENSVQVTIV